VTRYWVSWKEYSADYRPITFPPNDGVIAWWCSGEAGDGSYFTMVALVRGKSERAAKAAIGKDWPSKKKREWRFVTKVENDWRPGDRFPLSSHGAWAKERIEAAQ